MPHTVASLLSWQLTLEAPQLLNLNSSNHSNTPTTIKARWHKLDLQPRTAAVHHRLHLLRTALPRHLPLLDLLVLDLVATAVCRRRPACEGISNSTRRDSALASSWYFKNKLTAYK